MVVAEPIQVLAPRVTVDGLGDVLELAGLVGVARGLLVLRPQPSRGGGEHLESLRRAVPCVGTGSPVGQSSRSHAVDLVADDRVGEAERVAVTEVGSLEDPVVGSLDGVGAGGARDAEPVARVAAPLNVSPIVEVSGRPTRRSTHAPVSNRSSGVPSTGSSAASYL